MGNIDTIARLAAIAQEGNMPNLILAVRAAGSRREQGGGSGAGGLL